MSNDEASTGTLRIIFAGTPDFAATSLQALIETRQNLVAVYTQPDRPAGRGRRLHASPVKKLAERAAIPVHQPACLKHKAEQEKLAALEPDLIVVVAYGLLLPPSVLAIPKLGCINVHASLLPRWRGAAPIQAAILAGDDVTGITVMQMDAGLDTGDMLFKQSCKINSNETGSKLHDRLAKLGAESLLKVLPDLTTYHEVAEKQDDSKASYAGKIEKQQAAIDWHHSAGDIALMVLAFNAWPVAYSEINDMRVRIWQAKPVDQPTNAQPGTIINCSNQSIDIACGKGVLKLTNIQLPGAKAMPVSAVLNSKRDLFKPGQVFKSR